MSSFPLILLARAVQGAGAASVNPLAMAMIIELVHPQRRGKALGMWNSSGPIAGFLGPLIAGAIIDALGWRAILVPALVIAVVAIVIMAVRLPESERRVPLRQLVRSFDWTGVALFDGAVAMLVFYTSSRPITGLDPFTDLRFLVSGTVLLVGFLWWSRRRSNPFVDLSIFRGRNFTMASIAVSLRMVLRGGTGFLVPLLVADLYDFSAAAIGALLMLDAGALLITMWICGIVIDRRQSRSQIVVGLGVEAVAMLGFVLMPAGAPVAWVFVILAVNALGAGYCLAALHLYAMTGVSPQKSATAAGLYSMIRFAGSLLGPAIGGVVLSAGVERCGVTAAGYRTAFVFLLVVGVVGAASAFGLTRRIPDEALDAVSQPA